MPQEIWDAMKKIGVGLTIAILTATVIGAYARMDQVPKNTEKAEANAQAIQEVKDDLRDLRTTVERGNKQVVLEIRKLGKAIKKEADSE